MSVYLHLTGQPLFKITEFAQEISLLCLFPNEEGGGYERAGRFFIIEKMMLSYMHAHIPTFIYTYTHAYITRACTYA
jgi:hypothetical protein